MVGGAGLMYPREYAQSTPDKPAIVMARSGARLTYRELEEQANQVAHLFRAYGLKPGDRVAFLLENRLEVFPFVWGAQRAGLLYVAISTHLKPNEALYILEDSGAKVVLASDNAEPATLAAFAAAKGNPTCLMLGNVQAGWRGWSEALDARSTRPIEDEAFGADMLYSSGTTGRPKGVVPELQPGLAPDAPLRRVTLYSELFSMNEACVYLCPAPLYHAAPLRWTLLSQQVGGTSIIMERFDAEESLRLIDAHRVTHGLFVPTHFVRMLRLPEKERARYDMSTIEIVVHAGAPCPIGVKQAMIDWWGPKIYEYYAGSEGNGFVAATAQDWLERPGTVGRSVVGTLHICDDNGEPLPVGSEGLVYFEGGPRFSYNGDPEKTRNAYNRHGWSTLGDIGRLDEDGYLFLTDRKNFTIISGGVNIYPQEIENHIITHPKVRDVAVFGVPDEEYGERVVAVVEPVCMDDVHEGLAEDIEAYCRHTLSGVKTPRQIDFVNLLPRTDTGKLQKRALREKYRQGAIVQKAS